MANVNRSIGCSTLIGFQINRDHPPSTVDIPDSKTSIRQLGAPGKQFPRTDILPWIEIGLILLFFIGFAGQPVPHVNEAHYLTKAKHFWNPNWCANDFFLSSPFVHWMFYAGFGWLTLYLPLAPFAWLGRLGTWVFLAWAWRRLSWRMVPFPLIAPLSAVLFFLLNSRFHLAGEWVVGGFEAKGIAYGFLIWGLAELVADRWKRSWCLFGLAAAIHVLVGGWGAIAAGWVWLLQRRSRLQATGTPVTGIAYWRSIRIGIRDQAQSLLLAAFLFVVGAAPSLILDWSASPETRQAASQVYVIERLAHHLTFDGFPVSQVSKFTAMLVAWFVIYRWCARQFVRFHQSFFDLSQFTLGSLLISLCGLILSGLASETGRTSAWAIGLLRLYWFRLSDVTLPATLALTVGWVIAQWWNQSRERARKCAAGLAAFLIMIAGLVQIAENHFDPRSVADQRSLPRWEDRPDKDLQLYRKWRQVCDWIRLNTEPDSVFITPAQQQTFKWWAERAEVVSWKDIPQDADSILEWDQRVDQLILPQHRFEAGIMSFSDSQLRELGARYGATHLLVPQWQADTAKATSLKRVYPESGESKAAFVIFEF
jgi:hypothetical protein